MLDAENLNELVCIPKTAGINVMQLRYLRPDGTEVAFAERHSKGLSKLRRYTGTDLGNDRDIDLRAGDGAPFLRVRCKPRGTTTGLVAELEQPIGTPYGAIRFDEERYPFELTDGHRAGELGLPDEQAGGRPIRDDAGNRIGVLAVAVKGERDPTLVDLATDYVHLTEVKGTQAWSSAVTTVQVRLDTVPTEPLRSFVLAVPIVAALGHRHVKTTSPPAEA